jgi:hypothetical protein
MPRAEQEVEGLAERRMGGVPIWVWGAIVAVVILGYVWWKNSHAPVATATDTTQPTDLTGTGTIDPNTGLPLAYTGGGLPYSPTLPGQPGIGGFVTNSQWIAQAEYAAGQLGHSQLDILQALTNWLTGQTLTATQQAIVNSVIGLIGLPPDMSGVAPSQPGTGTTTPPPATAKKAISITPTGAALPAHTNQALHLLVQWSGEGAGTNAFYAEEKSSVTLQQWSIVHTFYGKGASGQTTISLNIYTIGTVQVRVRDLHGTNSNYVTLKLAKPTVPTTPHLAQTQTALHTNTT